MNETYQDLINNICNYTKEQWEQLIWERTHGIDTQTNLLIPGDSYPEQLLQDIYGEILIRDISEEKEFFINGLKKTIYNCLQECEKRLKNNQNDLINEVLVLERNFNVINHFGDGELNKIKDRGILQICQRVYHFVYYQKNKLFFNEIYGSLRRIVLLVCFRLDHNFIPLEDLKHEIQDEETCVVAFRCLCQKEGLEAIGKYFPMFVTTSFRAGMKVLVYLELKQLKRDYFNKFPQEIKFHLNIALKRIKQQSEEQYEFVYREATELNLIVSTTTEDDCITTEDDCIRVLCSCVPEENDNSKNNAELATNLSILFFKKYPKKYVKFINFLLALEEYYPNYHDLSSIFENLVEIVGLAIISEHFDELRNLSYKSKFLHLSCFVEGSPLGIFPNTKNNDYIGEIYLSSSPEPQLPLKVKNPKEFETLLTEVSYKAGTDRNALKRCLSLMN